MEKFKKSPMPLKGQIAEFDDEKFDSTNFNTAGKNSSQIRKFQYQFVSDYITLEQFYMQQNVQNV